MSKKLGALIKKARTEAGLTQQALAKKVTGASAADIGKAERGEKELSRDQLKQIALATGVTQKSLLDAASGAKKTSSAEVKLTASEKTLLELYRKADPKTKSAAVKLLRGEGSSAVLENILGSAISALTGKK